MGKGLSIEFNGFAQYAEKIDCLGGDLQSIFIKALTEAGKQIQNDTRSALDHTNLPAGGAYSTGETANTLVDVNVQWLGSIAELPVGFDKSKAGAGGFLITGTPRMRPDMALNRIYRQSGYSRKIKQQIEDIFKQEVNRLMGD